MYTVKCLNPIASKGLDLFTEDFKVIDDLDKADAVLVRSAAMHDLTVPESLLAVARAGAGVNNIPLDEYAKKGIVAFNTPGANANGVKELVVAGLLLASRDIIGGYNWVKENASEENLAMSGAVRMPSSMIRCVEGAKVITESSSCRRRLMRAESVSSVADALLPPHPTLRTDTTSAARSVAHVLQANLEMRFAHASLTISR